MSSGSAVDAPPNLQEDIQRELERREWAEPGDTVMAEYVSVMLTNGNSREVLQAEMEDLVGAEFQTSFLDWLFAKAAPAAPAAPAPAPATSAPAGGSRMLSSAIEGSKRKMELIDDDHHKRRMLDRPLGAPAGPRGWQDQNPQARPQGNRPLAERLAGPPGGRGGGPGGMSVRGAANGGRMGRGGMGGPGMGPGFRPPHFNGQQGQQGFMPGQQEMMMQMMAMQANMAQMAQQMTMMAQEKSSPRPARPPPSNKLPPGVKLGSHAVSSAPPKANVGPIPDKPSSTALCKYGVGCTNSRCIYSHPSPAADEKSGMVLSEEPCEAGKDCKDPECVKSHVSPAAVLGASAGPTRVLCKFQNCTNPTCQYRHEDAEGNFIPPPALAKGNSEAAADASSSEALDGEVTLSLDKPLGETKPPAKPCRYGERCTRSDCKFTHPSSRPTPRGGRPAPPQDIGGGMTASRKFAASAPLNPSAGEFKPAAEKSELEVSM